MVERMVSRMVENLVVLTAAWKESLLVGKMAVLKDEKRAGKKVFWLVGLTVSQSVVLMAGTMDNEMVVSLVHQTVALLVAY